MNRHDYSQNNTSSILSGMKELESTAENNVLSIEDMPYDWNTGILNTVIEWFEVNGICHEKDELLSFLRLGKTLFTHVAGDITRNDVYVSGLLDKSIENLNNLNNSVNLLASEFDKYNNVQKMKSGCALKNNESESQEIQSKPICDDAVIKRVTSQFINKIIKYNEEKSAVGVKKNNNWNSKIQLTEFNKYKLDFNNEQTIECTDSSLIENTLWFSSCLLMDSEVLEKIEDGFAEIHNGRIDLIKTLTMEAYIEVKNSVANGNTLQYNDLASAIKSVSFESVLVNSKYSATRSGGLKAEFSKSIDENKQVICETEFNPVSAKITLKYTVSQIVAGEDVSSKNEISYVVEKNLANMNLRKNNFVFDVEPIPIDELELKRAPISVELPKHNPYIDLVEDIILVAATCFDPVPGDEAVVAAKFLERLEQLKILEKLKYLKPILQGI